MIGNDGGEPVYSRRFTSAPLETCLKYPGGPVLLKPVKILILGGTGNISGECASLLHQRGHEVSLVTRGQSEMPACCRPIRADRKKSGDLHQALEREELEIVIDFLGYDLTDAQTAFEIFQGRVRQFIFISTTTVYARSRDSHPLTEENPLGNPWWDYARKKIECERWLGEQQRERQFPLTIVRPSHTYSRRWIPNPVSSSSYSFAARLERGLPVFVPDDGQNPWTLTAAEDFAVGLAGLVGNKAAIGEAFHITGDEVLTWNRIYEAIINALGVKAARVVPVPTDFICAAVPELTGNLKGDKSLPGVFDNSKIKRYVPEFRTRKRFAEGVRESVEWLRRHPAQQNLSPQVDDMIERVLRAWEKDPR